jgi:hypothetical protein
LYPGNQTSEKSLFETIQQLEALLQLHDRRQRGGVLIRLDAGFGNDQNINWLLHRGYQVFIRRYLSGHGLAGLAFNRFSIRDFEVRFEV